MEINPPIATKFEVTFRRMLARYISSHSDHKPILEVSLSVVEYNPQGRYTAVVPASDDVPWQIDWLTNDELSSVFYRKLSYLQRSSEYRKYRCEKPFKTFIPFFHPNQIPPLESLSKGLIELITGFPLGHVQAYLEPDCKHKLQQFLFSTTVSKTQ